METKKNKKVCIIGAGCSGLTAIKNLIQAGVNDIVCFEKNDQIGGNWVFSAKESHSSVCETTHIISSKKLSEYIDFPMPDDYPDYPSHQQILAYFNAYADHFDLRKYIQFNTSVEKAEKTENEKWKITLNNGEVREFDYLLVSNGHHSTPRIPDFPGTFTGEMLHSHQYKTNNGYESKRVLVIGAGNSGCDCAVEISRVADYVAISMRRPYYIIPKFLMGRPTDTYNELLVKLPGFVQKISQKISLLLSVGDYREYGLEKPDYPITKCHPVLNSELLYKIRHGKVHPKKGVERFEGRKVYFKDGTVEEFDIVLAATGYKIVFPFFDKNFIDYSDSDRIPLYLRMIDPKHPTLFFIGLVQPQGCVWPISDYQSKLVANLIAGRTTLPKNLEKLAEQETNEIASGFIKSKRHTLEVHYHPFVKKIKNLIPENAPEWKTIQNA